MTLSLIHPYEVDLGQVEWGNYVQPGEAEMNDENENRQLAAERGFEPDAHRLSAPHFFEDLQVGQKFPLSSRTVGDANFAAFQTVSGDNHPIHYDVEYCRRRGYPNLLAHGLQVVCFTAPGAGMLPHYLGDSLIAMLEQSSKFLAAVCLGDTVYPELEIVELTPSKTTGVITLRSTIHNQRGELVLEGQQKMLVYRREAMAN